VGGINKLSNFLNSGAKRSVEAKKNIVLSFGNRGLSILINLLLVPLTIHYVNPTQYGIWLTISSVIQWISFFDLGFAHGFRNKFAEAKANNDIILAKKYVSTTYSFLILIFGSVFLVFAGLNNYLDWSQLLNISSEYKTELGRIVFVLVLFVCIQLIANIFSILMLADQKPAFASFILTLGQLISLIVIYILTKTSEGNLFTLSLVSSAIPAVVIVVISILMFLTKYKHVAPSIKYIDFGLAKNILGLGGKFFIIQLCMLFTLQLSNIILSRIQGPIAVTEYNISYKYFSILYMIFVIVFTPFWSAFTDAYTKKEYIWMKNAYKKLFTVALLSIPLSILMVLIFPYIYKLWINDDRLNFSYLLLSLMALYSILLTFGNLFMLLINGTGKILLQTYIYLIFSVISIPLTIFFVKQWGTPGAVAVPILVYFSQSILGYIQLQKILNNKLNGMWSK